ncbi:MAG: Hsp70 family protein, partial [Acidobacteria bacterium]|nr:Hsp70 family protein [Acidobacteriota bacterium]
VLVDDTLATLLQCGELLPNGENQRPLVFSWGAGSFSAVVYERRRLSYQAVGQDGDRNLGGDLLDSFVASALAAQVRSAVGEAWKQEREFHGHLVREAEQAKRVLLTGKALRVPLGRVCPTVASRSAGELVLNLAPDALLGLFEQLLDQALERTVQALRACGAEQPSSILLVGGCANLPPVRDALALRFGVPIHSAGEGDVACGAVLHGRMLGDQDWTTANGPPVAPAGPAPQSAPAVRWAERFSPFLDKAQQLEAQGRAVEALSAFEELQTELGRLSASIYVRVAKEREGEGREQEAVAVLERAIERDRTNYAVARALGDLCYRRAVKHYEARRFDAALAESLKGADALGLEQRRPGAPPTRLAELKHLQALALQATGRLDAAEAAMAEAARLDPAQKVFREDLDRLRAARKAAPKPVPVSTQAKPGRNELCPCGSGRKYKRCHGH